MHSKSGPNSPKIKFCFDDCEVLDQFQRRSLNSLVRQSRSPVSWVIASVGKSQWAGHTFINSQPLTDADRIIISLDRREKEDFSSLCQAVASMRLLFSLPDERRPDLSGSAMMDFFNLEERLGKASINQLLHKVIKKSSKQIARDVRDAAQNLRSAQEAIGQKISDPSTLPYYEAYVLLHWQGDSHFSATYNASSVSAIEKYAAQFGEVGFSGWLRRKQVNALLQFCAKMSVKRVPICGADHIVSISDRSICDFLEIMAEVFDEQSRKKFPRELWRRFDRQIL